MIFKWLAKTWETNSDTNTPEIQPKYSQTENYVKTTCQTPTLQRSLANIIIEGEPEFVKFVGNCLFKISEHGDFVEVVSLLKQIKQVDTYASAGMVFTGRFDVDLVTLSYYQNDFVWGASQIIHDATHYQRMLNCTFNWKDLVAEELIAFRPQEQFLRDCGAYSQAAFVAGLDGRHCLR